MVTEHSKSETSQKLLKMYLSTIWWPALILGCRCSSKSNELCGNRHYIKIYIHKKRNNHNYLVQFRNSCFTLSTTPGTLDVRVRILGLLCPIGFWNLGCWVFWTTITFGLDTEIWKRKRKQWVLIEQIFPFSTQVRQIYMENYQLI